jgi:glycine betaine/proline transport system ATP-binding protein
MENPFEILIQVVDLWKVFGAPPSTDCYEAEALVKQGNNGMVCAVRDVSFQVRRGEVFVIMGLSGSGKSTLIRCFARLIEPTSGQILVNGRDIVSMRDQSLTEFRRREIAMVFQHYGLLPHRTVLENVHFGLKLRGENRTAREEKAMQVIEKVGLSGWENHYPHQLSGGMRQRVGIARALVQDTEILLMDEPFSGLDPLIKREMQDELLRLQKEFHKTIIFVTHDLSEALRLGSRMAVMKEGSFVQVGTPGEIVADPADDYVRRFVHDERKLVHFQEGKMEHLSKKRNQLQSLTNAMP